MGYLLYENKGFTSAMMNFGDVLQLNECLQCHLMLNTFILTWEGTTMAENSHISAFLPFQVETDNNLIQSSHWPDL